MAGASLTFDAVRAAGLTLPDVVASTTYGSPALKMRGNLMACVPAHKSAEPNCAAFRIDFELRTALIKKNPKIYYVTDHYADHPMVLVRLSRLRPKELRDLLGLAWSFASSKPPSGGSTAKSRRPRSR